MIERTPDLHTKKRRVVVVDADPKVRDFFKRELGQHEIKVFCYKDEKEVLKHLERIGPDIIILDGPFSEKGVEALSQLKDKKPLHDYHDSLRGRLGRNDHQGPPVGR